MKTMKTSIKELRAMLADAEKELAETTRQLHAVTAQADRLAHDLKKCEQYLGRQREESARLQNELIVAERRAESAEGTLAVMLHQAEAATLNVRAVMAANGVDPKDAMEALYQNARARRFVAKQAKAE